MIGMVCHSFKYFNMVQTHSRLGCSNTRGPRFTNFPSNLINLIAWENKTETLRMFIKSGLMPRVLVRTKRSAASGKENGRNTPFQPPTHALLGPVPPSFPERDKPWERLGGRLQPVWIKKGFHVNFWIVLYWQPWRSLLCCCDVRFTYLRIEVDILPSCQICWHYRCTHHK